MSALYYGQQDCNSPATMKAPDCQREPYVAEQTKRLESMIARIESDIESAENRFSAVVRPLSPAPTAGIAPNEEHRSIPLACHLADLASRINAQSDRLRSLIDRCEL